MKIIHTSDWHLGGRLHDQERYAEHEAFAAWLKALLRRENADVLVVAGDVFDTGAPSNRAQEIYFSLLAEVYKDALCRTVVVVGGNHDSPSLLEAPATVLNHLHVRVVGEIAAAAPTREVVLVPDRDGRPALAIAAVPYLREGDLRTAEAGESEADRTAKVAAGFRAHYEAIASLARQQARDQAGRDLPLVLTGHLYLTGAQLSDDRSERALRIGNLGAMPRDLLPAADYCALGHLHTPQAVGNAPACRYSGSPLALSFAEAGQAKSVTVVECGPNPGAPVTVRLVDVPAFQRLAQLKGSPDALRAQLRDLVAAGTSVWVEVQVTEGEGDLRPFWDEVPRLVENSAVRVLACQNCRPETRAAVARDVEDMDLTQLTPLDIFRMRLADDEALTDGERETLEAQFAEVLKMVQEADTRRE